MADLFSVLKTFRPRRTIKSEDANNLQNALKASFDLLGTAPPNGQTGVSSTFTVGTATHATHAVTKAQLDASPASATAAAVSAAAALVSENAAAADAVLTAADVVTTSNFVSGLSTTFSSPNPLGDVTPNTGAFTTGSFSGSVDVAGDVAVEGEGWFGQGVGADSGNLQVGGSTSTLGLRFNYDQSASTTASIYNQYAGLAASKIQFGFGTTLGSNVALSLTKDLDAAFGRDVFVAGLLTVDGGVYLGGTVAANLLDDYEKGTWTPIFWDSVSDQTSSSVQSATYTKIGDCVFIEMVVLNVDTTGMTAGSPVYLKGLPFTPSSAGVNDKAAIGAVQTHNVTTLTGSVFMQTISGQTYARLVEQSTTGESGLIISDLTSGTATFRMNGWYRV